MSMPRDMRSAEQKMLQGWEGLSDENFLKDWEVRKSSSIPQWELDRWAQEAGRRGVALSAEGSTIIRGGPNPIASYEREHRLDREFYQRLVNDPRHRMTQEDMDYLMNLPRSSRGKVFRASFGMPPQASLEMSSLEIEQGDLTGPASNVSELIAPPSSEERTGAPTSAARQFGVEVFLRLPLPGKRDAFVQDGFLYVREPFFKKLQGECCEPFQRDRRYHSSDCMFSR